MSATDPDSKMKDGTTHLAYKPEHAVDLDTGAVVAAETYTAGDDDTTTLERTLQAARANLAEVGMVPTDAGPAELAPPGYHSRALLNDLEGGVWEARIAEPRRTAVPSLARRYRSSQRRLRQPQRLRSTIGKQIMRQLCRCRSYPNAALGRSPTT